MKKRNWNFEEFTRVNSRIGKSVITIRETGIIVLNAGFQRNAKKELENCPYVKLFLDKNSGAIGINFTSNKELGVLKLSATYNNNRTFAAKSFFNYHRLDLEELCGKYESFKETVSEEECGSMWILCKENKISD